MIHRSLKFFARLGLGAVVFALASPAVASDYEVIEGQLDVIWGDPPPESRLPPQVVLTLTEDDGTLTEITISDRLAESHGGFLAWNQRRVRAHLAEQDPNQSRATGSEERQAVALTLLESRDTQSNGSRVSGSQPWVSILCKFADVPDEPNDLNFFQGMYANVAGGLDDYWRKQSYGRIDIAGSVAIDWVELPRNHSFYIPEPGDGTDSDRGALFEDCTAAADPFVDFSRGGTGGYSGINQMFNAELDCCAWGGSRFTTLDGETKSWRVTWEPPWAYGNSSVIAHEMGHGFGLPHSNNFDGDDNPYDSPWDVMSSTNGYAISDVAYGLQGKHHTAYHKSMLGWLGSSETRVVFMGETATVTLDAMALQTTPNYRAVLIPVPNTDDYYTVEARKRMGYDGAIVDDAVIIAHIDTSRIEPVWTVDTDNPPSDYGDNEGSMFRPGEVFIDAAAGVSISVDSETTTGFVVSVGVEDVDIFSDQFESMN